MSKENIHCERCEAVCRVAGPRNPDAKMLRHLKEGRGLCVNCAVHDWLRNTYPPNILLAQSGPKVLLYPHIQEQFAGIMRIGLADAMPDEIDWERIVENWDLPFPTKMKPSSMNPCNQEEIDAIKAGTHPGLLNSIEPSKRPTVGGAKDMLKITSLEQLNELEPGLGDEFGKLLRAE